MPIVAGAVKKLRQRDRRVFETMLAPSACKDLSRHLQTFLLKVLRPTLSTSGQAAMRVERLFSNRSKERRGTAALNLQLIFEALPGVEETVGLVIADWIRSQQRMLHRLRRDWNELAFLLPTGASLSLHIRHLNPGLSDPHYGADTLTFLDLQCGERLIYKPRPCDGEEIWFSALAWVNTESFGSPFLIPRVISRGSYCWMSYIEHNCCDSKESVRAFYFRWGAQAAIAQILGCADLHRQNWIAAGDQPVLVDAEMLGYSLFHQKGFDRTRLRDHNLHPLLRTGLLPLSKSDGAGYYKHIAPFETAGPTDESRSFWPSYGGTVHYPQKYADEILNGFTSASRFLCSPRRNEKFSRFVLRAAYRSNLRVLRRATAEYYRLLSESLQPHQLRQRGQRLEYLISRCGRDGAGSTEAKSLFRCSIPRFREDRRHYAQRQKVVPTLRTMLDSAELLANRLGPEFGHA
jgi:lantibiotic modifying enzyme